MADAPNDLQYTKTHEWIRHEKGEIYTVGITDHAQHQLGDLVFVELPEVDADVNGGDEVVVVESVKTAADVYSPLTGKIVEVNESLESQPALVNQDPYGDGWLFRIKIEDDSELDDLLDADGYNEEIAEE
jgi:glycine cleavage system H protein